MPTINFSGLASGLDTRAIVDAIMEAERKPLERLQEQQQLFSDRRAAFEELRGKLNSFESALRQLKSDSVFRGRTIGVTDDSFLTGTAGSGADVGQFEISVTALAKASKHKSDGVATSDGDEVAEGTITLQAGSNEEISIDVSAANGNTSLQAIRDQINAADAGVAASIINDGTSYRLIVRSEETGVDNALQITDGTDLNLDNIGANRISEAADAELEIDGIDVTSSSNKVTGAIAGVTLDLKQVTTGPVTLTVEQNTDAVVDATKTVLEQYNELVSFFNAQNDREDPGPLAFNSVSRGVQYNLQNLISSGVDGLPVGTLRSLGSIGVDLDGFTGEASLDETKLRDLLATNFDDVGNLFLSSGTTTDPRVQYISNSAATAVGTYDIEVTSLPEAASVVGNAFTNLRKNEVLTITVGADELQVALNEGDNASEAAQQIDDELQTAGIGATAFVNSNGELEIATTEIGSDASITVVSNKPAVPTNRRSGFGVAGKSDTGSDLLATIDGVEAIANGTTLSAAEGTAAEGLIVKLTSFQVGSYGTVSFSKGFVDRLASEIDQVTAFGTGILDVTRDGLDRGVERLSDDISRLESRLAQRETRLLRTFAEAERAISALQGQQSSFGAIG